jgi:nitrite reductase/ring-hydroxylating ferredoxin subunit
MITSVEQPRGHSFPFEARTQDEIMAMLRAEGVTFRTFDCVNEGDYAPEDAAWNYMDIPHLTYVHKQVDGVLTLAADQLTGSIFFQKIPFFRLPLTVLIYQTKPNAITYYTSFSFFLVVIETTWEAIGKVRTRVTTRYAVGWTSWLAGLAYPLIKRLLVRNYGILMSEDLPMRFQRGALRKRGYDFRMSGPVPSFIESRKIMQQNVVVPEQNVIAPADAPRWDDVALGFADLTPGSVRLVGAPDHLGLAVTRVGDAVQVFPRLCPHEGAGLDDAARQCAGKVHGPAAGQTGSLAESCVVQCPWHGRKFRPLLSVPLPAARGRFETAWHRFDVDGEALRIGCKQADAEALRRADWSQAARAVVAPADRA